MNKIVVEESREVNYPDYVPLLSAIICGLGVGCIAGLFVGFVIVPRQRRKIADEFDNVKQNEPLINEEPPT